MNLISLKSQLAISLGSVHEPDKPQVLASHFKCVHEADKPLFKGGAHKQKTKMFPKMPAEAAIALISQSKVFVCVCVYKHRQS